MLNSSEAHRQTIGLVDDDEDSRLVLRAILEPEYDVAGFTGARAALRQLRRLKPVLIILDIALPDMDGIELLQRLRRQRSLQRVPAFAYTGFTTRAECRRYSTAGFAALIGKPIIDVDEVVALVRSAQQ